MATLHEQGMAQMQQVTDARQRLDSVLTPERRVQAANLIGPPVGTRWAAQQTP